MADELNPALYRKLEQRFGPAKVSNRGEAFMAQATKGVLYEPRLTIAHAGEYYQVNCPFCNDTRRRLFVNHMFGQKDGHGRRMTFLAICYNEGCLSKPANRQNFLERMNDNGWLESTRVTRGVDVPEEAREVMWPGPCKLLSKLKASHPANAYLSDRGFDYKTLAEKFGVSYCTSSDYFLAQNRIIIPVFDLGKLKGWQARYVGELAWKDPDQKRSLPPKYFSCPNSQFRSRCVYNLDSMREWETGVVVEGPTDVYRGGSMFGCIFGNTVTEAQSKRLLRAFRGKTLVLCLDPEEFESSSTQRRITEFTAKMSDKTFCAVKLPDSTDPGGLDRDFLKEYIRAEAADRGVKVVYRKRA